LLAFGTIVVATPCSIPGDRHEPNIAPELCAVIDLFLPPSTKRLIVYPSAIDTRWGPERLRAACEGELGVKLDNSTAVLFHNRARDTLVLYALDADRDRCVTKKLDRGVFLLPVPVASQKYVVIDASKVATLFRS
jgi:IS66 Orf2 like protein